MEIQAKDFNTRADLEAYITAEFGNSISKNRDAGHIVKGKREELKKLSLSDLTTIFGVRCKITDDSSESYKKIIKK